MSLWQPIETAPKDGTKVLVWGYWAGEINGPQPEPGCYIAHYNQGSSDYPGYNWTCSGTDAYAAWVKATHWIPLPDEKPLVEVLVNSLKATISEDDLLGYCRDMQCLGIGFLRLDNNGPNCIVTRIAPKDIILRGRSK